MLFLWSGGFVPSLRHGHLSGSDSVARRCARARARLFVGGT